jgi:hypothetical protein
VDNMGFEVVAVVVQFEVVVVHLEIWWLTSKG